MRYIAEGEVITTLIITATEAGGIPLSKQPATSEEPQSGLAVHMNKISPFQTACLICEQSLEEEGRT